MEEGRWDYDRWATGLGLWERETAVCPDEDTHSGAKLRINLGSMKVPSCVS